MSPLDGMHDRCYVVCGGRERMDGYILYSICKYVIYEYLDGQSESSS